MEGLWVFLFLILVFALLLYYMLFSAPKSDRIFSSRSEEELIMLQRYIEGNGIKTYTKNIGVRRFHGIEAYMNDLDNPTLHVIDPVEQKQAIALIQQLSKG